MAKPNDKRWFSDGATMSHPSRLRGFCWLINLVLYALLNMFILRIQTGSELLWKQPEQSPFLVERLLNPVNIFNFPSYIFVTAMFTALLCAIPLCIALFYNLLHAIPFVLLVLFLGHNPPLCLALFVGCALISFEPFRFKSKFIASILAMLPVILYWVLFAGNNPQENALRWAIMYAPWVLAFLITVIFFGVVIGLGHFMRYRPGIMMPVFGLTLAGTVVLFHFTIGMIERDFQADVYAYSPGNIKAFRSQNIMPLLEEELGQRLKERPYLNAQVEMNQLRTEWLWAFNAGPDPSITLLRPGSLSTRELTNFFTASYRAVEHIDAFIARHPNAPRIADALYYRGLLFDLRVDIRTLRDEDTLRYYTTFPSSNSEGIWKQVLNNFDATDMALEARYRLAQLAAATIPAQTDKPFGFNEALSLLQQADTKLQERISSPDFDKPASGWWFEQMPGLFTPPPPTISAVQLRRLEVRIGRLMDLLNKENRSGHEQHDRRLATFIGLDPRQLDYEHQLKILLNESPKPDPLIDNIELAYALLERDPKIKLRRLKELAEQYPRLDGGIQARLEYVQAILERRETEPAESADNWRVELEKIIELRPDLFAARYARKLLPSETIKQTP